MLSNGQIPAPSVVLPRQIANFVRRLLDENLPYYASQANGSNVPIPVIPGCRIESEYTTASVELILIQEWPTSRRMWSSIIEPTNSARYLSLASIRSIEDQMIPG